MSLEPRSFMKKMISRTNFSDEDRSLLNANTEWGTSIASEMADHFYTYLGRDEEMSAILNETEGRIHRLRETFVDWFNEMFTGMDAWGDAYAERRWKIGLIHVRIGIGPQHVVPAMAVVVEKLGQKALADGKGEAVRTALAKIAMIDLTFIEQAYIEVSSNAVLQETGWTEKLFRRLITTGANTM
ncbi:MAG: hypothetical protein HC799_04955 [Limnothrix sp. RL_2_0]|nr:hypothetical protein [Limnothrix sp. RL_2_0]